MGGLLYVLWYNKYNKVVNSTTAAILVIGCNCSFRTKHSANPRGFSPSMSEVQFLDRASVPSTQAREKRTLILVFTFALRIAVSNGVRSLVLRKPIGTTVLPLLASSLRELNKLPIYAKVLSLEILVTSFGRLSSTTPECVKYQNTRLVKSSTALTCSF